METLLRLRTVHAMLALPIMYVYSLLSGVQTIISYDTPLYHEAKLFSIVFICPPLLLFPQILLLIRLIPISTFSSNEQSMQIILF